MTKQPEKVMTDEETEAYRQKLIKEGIIIENPPSSESKYRARLIQQGKIVPGNKNAPLRRKNIH